MAFRREANKLDEELKKVQKFNLLSKDQEDKCVMEEVLAIKDKYDNNAKGAGRETGSRDSGAVKIGRFLARNATADSLQFVDPATQSM